MNISFRNPLSYLLIVSLCVLFSPRAIASDGSLSTSVIGMFPKDMGNFAYADLQNAHKHPLFSLLFNQFLPTRFQQFKSFVASAGIDFDSQIQEIAWGTIDKNGGDGVVGIALGEFNPTDLETRLQALQMPMIPVQGYHLYAFGTGDGPNDLLFAFLDSGTAAFGSRAALERLISVRMGGEDSLLNNQSLFPLIQEANGDGILWAVFDRASSKDAIDELVPQANAFPQAAAIVRRLRGVELHASDDDDEDITFRMEAKCASVEDANILGLALQAEIMYGQYQSTQSGSGIAGPLGHMTVIPSGADLTAKMQLDQSDLNLIKMEVSLP